MNKQKIKSFTILEMTVSMLIAGILVGLVYTAYGIIDRSWLSFHTKNLRLGEVEQLDKLLRKDFGQAVLIQKEQAGIVFHEQSGDIHYMFEPGFIVRNSTITDTFRIANDSLSAAFEGRPLDDDPAAPGRIDEVRFILLFDTEKIPLHYLKNYSSFDLTQSTTYAIH